MSFDIEKLIEDAKEGFDLRGELESAPKREEEFTVFTDERAGDLLGSPGEPPRFGKAAVEPSGILGLLAKFGEPDESDEPETVKERKELEKSRDKLIEKLESTAYTLGLRNIPPLIHAAVRREAKESLKIKGKVPENLLEEFTYATNKFLLAKTATYIYSHKANAVIRNPSPDDAGAVLDLLPEPELIRLKTKLGEILNRDTVSGAVTGSADF